MPFSLTWFISRRYIGQRKSIGFITLISYFSILGLILGISSLVTTLSILNGFEKTLKNKIISFESPLRVKAFHDGDIADVKELTDKIKTIPECRTLYPYIEREVLLRAGDVAEGVVVRGIEQRLAQSPQVNRTITDGSGRLVPNEKEPVAGMLVGQDLANRMEITTGKRVFLISPQSSGGAFTQPFVKSFVVSGIFNTGLYEYDNTFIFISIGAAQELFRMAGMITGFEIQMPDPTRADEIAPILDKKLGYPYFAQSWQDLHRTLFAWMKTQSLPILIVFGLIIIVGIFNLVSTLIMIVLNKKKNIGVLRAFGISKWAIIKIFFYQGMLIGIIGIGLGSLLGYGLCWLEDTFKFFTLNKDIYFVDSLPVSMHIGDFVIVAGGAAIICLLATLYPAYKAAKMLPTDAIRWE